MKVSADRILACLVEKYDNSVLSKQGSVRKLRIRFEMEKEFSEYYNYENYAAAQLVDEEISRFENNSWISVERNEERISRIELNTDKVDEICEYLGMNNRKKQNSEIVQLLEKYRNGKIDPYIDDIENRISNYENISLFVYTDLKIQEDVLKSLCAILKLDHDVLERVFSARVLNDSKAFGKISKRVAKLLSTYFSDEKEENEEDILAQFHVLQNPGHIIIKGNGTLVLKDSLLHIDDFSEGLTLSSSDVSQIIIKEIYDHDIMTIENLTVFYQIKKEDTLLIYLGGYHNTIRRDFLKFLYQKYPDKKYLHFGDIDAGGFYILEHLKNKTGIPFEPYMMDKNVLKQHHEQTIPLQGNDRKRLNDLLNQRKYIDTITYMLENDIKLEQEQLSFEE